MERRYNIVDIEDIESGEGPVLDPDFAGDVEEIVRSRKRRNPPTWG